MNTSTRHRESMQRNTAALLIRQMRPRQWTKNLVVFSAPLFAATLLQPEDAVRALAGFVIFCFVSSCVYIMNDFADLEADRSHPDKRFRPMASGLLPPLAALAAGAALLAASVGAAFCLDVWFGTVVVAYFALNVCYSFRLKHVVIVDMMAIAAGFVLRAVGGGLIIGVPITPWFLLCIMLLSLFLAIGKRRHELVLLEGATDAHRKVLHFYSVPLLDQMNGMVTSATMICYALFTFTSGGSDRLMLTIPFVLYGMFRYLYLIHIEKKGGAPDKLLLEDRHIQLTVLGYIATVFVVLYV